VGGAAISSCANLLRRNMARPTKGFEPSEEEIKQHARERSARYYAKHPDRALASGRKWRKANLEERKVVEREYRQREKERYRAHCIARRTKKTEAGGSFTAKEWLDLCSEYGDKCLCCTKEKPLTADHVIPISKGGTSWINNIQPLCLSCNCSKGDKCTDYRRTQK